MKILPSLLTLLGLASSLFALDSAELATVSAKFTDPSGDAQYAARVELNRMIDTATAPDVADRADAIRAVEETLANPETPAEAKKYLLRALARVGTAESVAAVAAVFLGQDAMLKEEARQVLAGLGGPEATAILSKAMIASTDPVEQLALLNALAQIRATTAVPAITALISNEEPVRARAAIEALGKIGDPQGITALGKLRTDGKLSQPLRQDIDKALLFAANDQANAANNIYQTTDSPDVKLAALLILSDEESFADVIRDAMKSDNAQLRLAALKHGLAANQTDLLQGGIDRESDPFSPNERLIILKSLTLLKPSEAAVKIALGAINSKSQEESALAISALGEIGGKQAFDAVFQSLSINQPEISSAVSQAIASIDAPGIDEFLLEKIQGPATPEKLLAIKAAKSRSLPGVRPLLLQIIQAGDKEPAQEAMKTLYAIGGFEELKSLCELAKTTTDPQMRGTLASFCKRFAASLATDEARQLADAL